MNTSDLILVTGANGNGGSEIVKALVAMGMPCRAMVRSAAKAGEIRLPGVQIVEGDFTNPASLDAAFSGVGRVMAIAPPAPNIVDIERNIIAAARKAGVHHIVDFSAVGASTTSLARFSRLHGHAEELIKSSGLSWTFLRPTFFMQNFLTMAGMIKTGVIYSPTGDGKAPFVDLADVGAVAAAALTGSGHEGKTYDITGPQSMNYAEAAGVFGAVLGKPVKFVNIPLEAARQSMIQMGIPPWSVDGINELSRWQASGELAATSDTVMRVTGRAPGTLEQWIQKNINAVS